MSITPSYFELKTADLWQDNCSSSELRYKTNAPDTTCTSGVETPNLSIELTSSTTKTTRPLTLFQNEIEQKKSATIKIVNSKENSKRDVLYQISN